MECVVFVKCRILRIEEYQGFEIKNALLQENCF